MSINATYAGSIKLKAAKGKRQAIWTNGKANKDYLVNRRKGNTAIDLGSSAIYHRDGTLCLRFGKR